MRNFINTVIDLHESVDIHPSVKRIEDGETYIDWPENSTTRKRGNEDCWRCEQDEKIDPNCNVCQGTGKEMETTYNFPMLNVANGVIDTIIDILGVGETDPYSGHIENKDLPIVMRTLIRLKNGDMNKHAYGDQVSAGETRVDHSGGMPRITTGPTMINHGRDVDQITRYVDRLIEIVKWAQEHDCDVSWA